MRQMTSFRDRTRDARSEAERDSGAPGLVRALRAQIGKRNLPREVSFEHEDYRGRNVLSIAVRDEDDVDEIPVYYEQRVFTRFRLTRPSVEDEGQR